SARDRRRRPRSCSKRSAPAPRRRRSSRPAPIRSSRSPRAWPESCTANRSPSSRSRPMISRASDPASISWLSATAPSDTVETVPMAKPAELEKLTGIASRFGAFVAERHPFALPDVIEVALEAFEAATGGREPSDETAFVALRRIFHRELTRRLQLRNVPQGLGETTPRTSAEMRLGQAYAQLLDDCDGFLRRAALEASLTRDERLEILRGMLLTRATDNRLKTFFTSGEIRYGSAAFQGKGFRSLGQEAIYAGGIRLRRGKAYRDADGRWTGDVIGPVIRDLGMTLAMR